MIAERIVATLKYFLRRNLFKRRSRRNSVDPVELNPFLLVRNGFVPFWGADYYIDNITGIVLTKQNNIFRGGYSIDFRGITSAVKLNQDVPGWECEYFCEPESVLSTFDNGEWKSVFTTYLNAKNDIFVKSTELVSLSYWSPGMGNLKMHLPSLGDEYDLQEPSVSLSEKIVFRSGNRVIKNVTTIASPLNLRTKFIYVYQDAAYLWFPRNYQIGVLPFVGIVLNNGAVDIFYGFHGAVKKHDRNRAVFTGNVDIENGVAVGIVSNQLGVVVGNIGWYLGFKRQVVVDGVSYAMVDPLEPLESDSIPDVGLFDKVNESSNVLRNIFIALTGSLDGYEAKDFEWARIMLYEEGGFSGMENVTHALKNSLSQYLDS